jgi:hypothetical protein
MEHFIFSAFGTASNDSPLNQNQFLLPNGPLVDMLVII